MKREKDVLYNDSTQFKSLDKKDIHEILSSLEIYNSFPSKETSTELKIIKILIELDLDFIPIKIFKDILKINDESLNSSIEKLKRESLIETRKKSEIKLNKQVQEFINNTNYFIKSPSKDKIFDPLIKTLNEFFPSEKENWKKVEVLYPLVMKVLDNTKHIQNIETANLYNRLGSYYQFNLDTSKAKDFYEKALKIGIKLCSPEHLTKDISEINVLNTDFTKINNINFATYLHNFGMMSIPRINEELVDEV